jgi:FKBP-type peptidyl-prolyl cis-trans isomerase FkpA
MKFPLLSVAGCVILASMAACNNTPKNTATKQTADTSIKVTEVATPAAAPAADDSLFVKDGSGLDCKWVTHGTGTKMAAVGDMAELSVVFKIGDSTLANTELQNNHKPVQQQITAPSMKGDLMSGLTKMKAGDSVVLRMRIDTFMSRVHQPKPAWARADAYITWQVKMVRVMNKAEMEADMAQASKGQNTTDDKLLQAYFKSHNIKNAKKTASGLYYTVAKTGTGAHPKDGQEATVNYTGQSLQGEKFDSNVDPKFGHVSPFSFVLGQHRVIRGWEEAVGLMNKGMKATFYLPSSIAYGAQGQGGKIGPNEVLMFDIELVSFK